MKWYKRLKVGDLVTAVFLGTAYDCEVIEIIDRKKKSYKLRMKSGTILPGVTWLKNLDIWSSKFNMFAWVHLFIVTFFN